MHSHNVFFWLKDRLSNSELKEFENGLKTLINVPLCKGPNCLVEFV
jgi:hypothetical protein